MRSLYAGVAALCLLAGAAAAQAPTQYALRPNALAIDAGVKTATAAAGAATLNKNSGVITTEALTTAAGANYTLTLTDAAISPSDEVFATVSYGSATAGVPHVAMITPGAGVVAIVIRNATGAAALNGTLNIGFFTLKN